MIAMLAFGWSLGLITSAPFHLKQERVDLLAALAREVVGARLELVPVSPHRRCPLRLVSREERPEHQRKAPVGALARLESRVLQRGESEREHDQRAEEAKGREVLPHPFRNVFS